RTLSLPPSPRRMDGGRGRTTKVRCVVTTTLTHGRALAPPAGRSSAAGPRRPAAVGLPWQRRSTGVSTVDVVRPHRNHDLDRVARNSTGQHAPARTVAKQPSTTRAPRSHDVEDRGTCRERIKAVTNVSAGHDLDRLRARRDSNP